MKKLLFTVLSILILSQMVLADDSNEVKRLLQSKLDAVISVLQQKELEQQTKNAQVLEIVTPLFDFSLMAKLSLGKKHWTGLTEEKKEEFTQLFVERLKESYLEKLMLYTDERIDYNEPVWVENKLHMRTKLISKDNNIAMLYKFYKSEQNWLIYDIEIQGVSIIISYRSQFDHTLSSGTIDDLLQQMEKPKNK